MSLPTEKAIKQDSRKISGFHQDFEILRNVSIFRGLDHECLKLLAMLCRRMEYNAGDQLVVQGEENDCAFLIISGRLDSLYTIGEKEHVISTYGPGQCVYGSALLGRTPPVFTLKAKEDTVNLCLRREEFHKALQQFPVSLARITDNLVSELVIWDRNLLDKQLQDGESDYQGIGVSLL